MGATIIKNALPGEDLLGIEPQLLQYVDPGWRHRLALFTGRALSDTALTNEQLYRSGRLALMGQAVTAGTVKGLELSVDRTATDPVLQVTPGYGIAATGVDVMLLRTLKTALSTLTVIDPVAGQGSESFKDFSANPANQGLAGILLLQPVIVQANGLQLDTGTGPLEVTGQLGASCDQDPEEYAFEDWQLADAARLVLVTWPTAPASLALPDMNPVSTLRNRLAYTVFAAEQGLGAEDRLPWEYLGVPLALAAFDSEWTLQFVDRASVVRFGGLPRRRYVLPGDNGLVLVQAAAAQARILQLAEQIGDAEDVANGAFALLPPSGVLPATALDFVNRRGPWFPPNWTLHAGPVHEEEIESVLLTGMKDAPLDVSQAEEVDVLVPLPDSVYDPKILVIEEVAPEFQQAVDADTLARDQVLQHRHTIQVEANALLTALGQPLILPDAGLNAAELAGRDGAVVFTPDGTEFLGTMVSDGATVSADISNLEALAAAAPYTVTLGDGTTLPLINAADWQDLTDHGLPHLIDRLNAKIAKADDLLDLAFLTSQTDIYRYRQNVLGNTDASRLAVSPILASIATGNTASATSQNLKNYLTSIAATKEAAAPPPVAAAPPAAVPVAPVKSVLNQSVRSVTSPTLFKKVALPNLLSEETTLGRTTITTKSASALQKVLTSQVSQTAFQQVSVGQNAPATSTDIVGQSPLVGAQLDLRTLTIAERLKQSPAQEALFYGVGNRLSFLQLLLDLEITVDDLPFLVDTADAPTASNPSPRASHTVLELKKPATFATVMAAVEAPRVQTDSDESLLFSTGVRVMEQHTQLMRAIEARIQQYRDFVTACNKALASIQNNLAAAQRLLKQLDNDLSQARQNLAFVMALLADEIQRVDQVNTQRQQVLRDYVRVVVYTRPRSLQTEADVASRQLIPANVTSPVPACLQQTLTVPPELREVTALLREAPINWLPAVQALLNRLERPTLFHEVAVSTQARATMQLQLPLTRSSAATSPGIYAPVIDEIYSAHQQVFRTFQEQRAAYQPVATAQLSWTAHRDTVVNTSAVADLLGSSLVHAEIVNLTSRIVQQITSVAVCVYLRVGAALPVERLEWAEFLRGTGRSVELRSLAVLPGWNSQPFLDRQNMQLLVDWLFQQIDTSNSLAVAFVSDVVRVAILLASHAPVNDVIAGAVALRTKPTVGGVITLTLPSERVGFGTHVELYAAGVLAAHAVVSDLDTSTVRATVTNVYKTDVFLETTDVVHYTAQAPAAVALRAFAR